MFELIALLTVGALVIGALALVGFLLKIVFKIALLPVWIIFGLLKLVFGAVLGLVGVVVGVVLAVVAIALLPVVILLFLFIGLPLLALAGLVGVGMTAVAA